MEVGEIPHVGVLTVKATGTHDPLAVETKPLEGRAEPVTDSLEQRETTVPQARPPDPQIGPFSVKLKLAREAAGLSQRELARRIGWDNSQISKLEKGQRIHLPPPADVQKLDDELKQDGRLMEVAGYLGGTTTIGPELREILDQHISAIVEEISRLLGR